MRAKSSRNAVKSTLGRRVKPLLRKMALRSSFGSSPIALDVDVVVATALVGTFCARTFTHDGEKKNFKKKKNVAEARAGQLT